MFISAIIGSESHTTSSGWAKLTVNGKRMSHREALTKEWLTKMGDKHANWVECVFDVQSGQVVEWDAGTNSGNRGANKARLKLRFLADESAETIETEDLGYPAKGAILKGKLRLVEDENESKAELHRMLKEAI